VLLVDTDSESDSYATATLTCYTHGYTLLTTAYTEDEVSTDYTVTVTATVSKGTLTYIMFIN